MQIPSRSTSSSVGIGRADVAYVTRPIAVGVDLPGIGIARTVVLGTGVERESGIAADADGFGDPGFPLNSCPEDNCPSDPNPGQVDTDSDGGG